MGFIAVTFFMESWFYDHDVYADLTAKEKMSVRKGKRFCNMVLYAFLTGMIFVSRWYLGMHSIDQVVFSWAYGSYINIIYKKFLRRRIHNFIVNSLANKKGTGWKIKWTVVFTIFFVIF